MLRLLASIILIFLYTAAAHAGPVDPRYEAIKAKYMKLRNTDRNIRNKAAWLAVIDELKQYAEKYPRAKNAGIALFQAASMYTEMYEVFQDISLIRSGVAVLKMIPERHKTSDQADDALMRLSEVYLELYNDKEGAEELLQRVITDYPAGDMLEAAKIRLKLLRGESPPPSAANAVTPSLPRALPAGPTVIIDPGHGGEDFGAVGIGGLYEKDVVLDVAKSVEKILVREHGYNVMLTRQYDEFIPLYQRTEIANKNGAYVFLSIHANASEKGNLSGFEIYYLDKAADHGSKKLADRENASAQFEGPESDLRYMLSDLSGGHKIADSIALAKTVGSGLNAAATAEGFRNLGIKKAPFYVLVGANMPCILVELGFVDHPVEGLRLGDKDYRARLARALALSVTKYLEK